VSEFNFTPLSKQSGHDVVASIFRLYIAMMFLTFRQPYLIALNLFMGNDAQKV